MTTGAIARTGAVAEATFLSGLSGGSLWALLACGAAYPLLVALIAAARVPGTDLLGDAENLYSALFLPLLLLIVCVVNGVGLFRTEIEEQTLVYPLGRTVPRPAIVVGKFLGFASSTLLVLVPSAILGTALAADLGTGPTFASVGLLEAIVASTVLGALAYGAVFLWLGLLTRQALVIGLLYGFIWEAFVSQLPGPIRTLTVVYYLRDLAALLSPSGPIGSGPTDVPILSGIVALALPVAAALVLASVQLRYAETPMA